MTSTAGLKISTLILAILLIACVVAGISQFLAAGGILQNRYFAFQATFFLYFTASMLLLWLAHKKLAAEAVLALLFLPVVVLTAKGLTTSWNVLYPYHFPLQTIIVISAEAIAYITYELSLFKKIAAYFVSAVLLLAICLVTMHDPLMEVYKENANTILTPTAPSLSELQTLRIRLIDTSGHKLTLNKNNYYILNFGYSTSAASQIKLQFLKEFAQQVPAKLKIIYIADAKMEAFEEFKSKLKADKNDKVIYAYLFDDKLRDKLGISKYPAEILIGPGFKFIRKQEGFYSFDANTYIGNTLSLIDP